MHKACCFEYVVFKPVFDRSVNGLLNGSRSWGGQGGPGVNLCMNIYCLKVEEAQLKNDHKEMPKRDNDNLKKTQNEHKQFENDQKQTHKDTAFVIILCFSVEGWGELLSPASRISHWKLFSELCVLTQRAELWHTTRRASHAESNLLINVGKDEFTFTFSFYHLFQTLKELRVS